MSRDTLAAILASVVVVIVVVLGFSVLGGPGTQRLVRSDERTVQSLAQLAQYIQVKYRSANDQLPANLDAFADKEKQDPLSHKAFIYRPQSENAYELCATFLSDNRHEVPDEPENGWRHPKGDFCFALDATKSIPQAPYYSY